MNMCNDHTSRKIDLQDRLDTDKDDENDVSMFRCINVYIAKCINR